MAEAEASAIGSTYPGPSGPTLEGEKSSSGPLKRTGTIKKRLRAPSNSGSPPGLNNDLAACECGHTCKTRSGLARHRKTCGIVNGQARNRSRCQFCDAAFDTYIGVRQHERRAHPDDYSRELQRGLDNPSQEWEIYETLAGIEASTKKGKPFIARMVEATGLPASKIDYIRRRKPVYRSYLEAARNSFAVASAAVEDGASVSRSGGGGPLLAPAPPVYDVSVPNQASGGGPAPLFAPGEASSSALPLDPDVDSSTNRDDGSLPSSPDLGGLPASPEVAAPDPAFQAFSRYLRAVKTAAVSADPALAGLAGAGLELGDLALAEYIESWIREHIPAGGGGGAGKKKDKKKGGGTGPNYGRSRGGSGPRAESFKKAQDLFSRDRKKLIASILEGKKVEEMGPEVTPPIEEFVELFGGIFGSGSPPDDEPVSGGGPAVGACGPFTPEEIDAAKLNWQASSPGLDGLTVPAIESDTVFSRKRIASQEWKHWLQTFENFALVARVQTPDGSIALDDSSRFNLLVNYVSPAVYDLISECTTYPEAVATLSGIYVKEVNTVYARHLLATRRQQMDENIDRGMQENPQYSNGNRKKCRGGHWYILNQSN
ncbi:unnamed protein product [Phyllotreta striolata]|uniref:C2H2-type domain-containing protein n=1 Tax=Phyllotreta striolata TaxID=444603 RepID=A0A9P0DWZ9_PHYSR|nr:unnamed protein product [Phyllotreta striolata]